MTQNSRLQWVDNLRGAAILLVILGHTLQYFSANFDSNHVANYIYAFHMPLFFMISGFCSTFSNHGIWKSVKGSMLQLLLPYVFWSLLFSWLVRYDWKETLILNPRYWFLLVLLYVRILHSVCRVITDKTIIPEWVIIIFTIILFCVLQFEINVKIPCFSLIYYYMIYYVVGYLFSRKYNVLRPIILKKWLLVVSTSVFLLWGWFFRRGIVPHFLSFIPGFVYFLPLALIGSFACFSLFIQRFDKTIRPFQFLGVNSLGIYVVSGLVCWLIIAYIPFIQQFAVAYWPLQYVLFILMSFVSCAVVCFFSRVNGLRPLIGLKFNHTN